jgi:hypothetical protein
MHHRKKFSGGVIQLGLSLQTLRICHACCTCHCTYSSWNMADGEDSDVNAETERTKHYIQPLY